MPTTRKLHVDLLKVFTGSCALVLSGVNFQNGTVTGIAFTNVLPAEKSGVSGLLCMTILLKTLIWKARFLIAP
jgi:hypothetical protein